jgi:predicted Zn-ribbon and HTH transcriptional regulator
MKLPPCDFCEIVTVNIGDPDETESEELRSLDLLFYDDMEEQKRLEGLRTVFKIDANDSILRRAKGMHMNLDEHLSKQQYQHLLKVAAQEGCNYFTFNIPNTVCNNCGHIDKRYLQECPHCHSKDVDCMTRIIGYLKRVSNFSQPRQEEASRRYYAHVE